MKVKEAYNIEDVFGDLSSKTVWSKDFMLQAGDIITITNSNCEFTYDSINNEFDEDSYYGFIVELELISTDLSEYEPAKSNNGGAYAYADCRVLKVIEEGY